MVRVRLGTIDNASANGSAGYEDFTCTQQTTLTIGTPATITINTGGTLAHDTRVYLDTSNDGILTASELVFQALNTANPTGTLNIPGTATPNAPLRLRIVSDFVGSNPQPCGSPTNGQVEDYTVTLRPNTSAPVAGFTSNYVAGACINPVQFTDQSTGAPTSWAWDFGDGGSSSQQNPSHQYTASNTYTVTLTVTNANGPNMVTRTNYLTIQVPCLLYCPSNGSGNAPGSASPLFLTSVAVSAPATAPGGPAYPAFSSTYTSTVGPTGGYTYYANRPITLRADQQHTYTGVVHLPFVNTTLIWIDYNRNGTFENSELLWPLSVATTLPATRDTYTNTFAVPETVTGTGGVPMSTVGTTRMRIQNVANRSNTQPNPCRQAILNGDVQDYPVEILPKLLATRAAQELPTLAVYPNPTADGHLHLRLTDAAASGPYAATVQNLLGATLLQTDLRLTPATDTELDLSQLPQGVYLLQLRDAHGRTALRRVVRE